MEGSGTGRKLQPARIIPSAATTAALFNIQSAPNQNPVWFSNVEGKPSSLQNTTMSVVAALQHKFAPGELVQA
jgi:hypothetical protein